MTMTDEDHHSTIQGMIIAYILLTTWETWQATGMIFTILYDGLY